MIFTEKQVSGNSSEANMTINREIFLKNWLKFSINDELHGYYLFTLVIEGSSEISY